MPDFHVPTLFTLHRGPATTPVSEWSNTRHHRHQVGTKNTTTALACLCVIGFLLILLAVVALVPRRFLFCPDFPCFRLFPRGSSTSTQCPPSSSYSSHGGGHNYLLTEEEDIELQKQSERRRLAEAALEEQYEAQRDLERRIAERIRQIEEGTERRTKGKKKQGKKGVRVEEMELESEERGRGRARVR